MKGGLEAKYETCLMAETKFVRIGKTDSNISRKFISNYYTYTEKICQTRLV